MLTKPLLDDTWATLQHEKGWFVMCRLNNLPGAIGEIAAGLHALVPHIPALLRDHKKAGQMHKAAWRLVSRRLSAQLDQLPCYEPAVILGGEL